MSEEVKDSTEGKKKKGKLPVIAMLVVLIAGGGFFGMKMKGGGAPKKPEVKSGEIAPIDKEFLINLRGQNQYLRVEIALELREGYKKEELDANMQSVRDTIIQIFRSKTLAEVSSDHTEGLKKEIAESINDILISHMKDEEKKTQEDIDKSLKPAKSEEGKSKKDEKSKDSEDSSDEPKNDWVCPGGPVLNVQFTNFTTQ